ncbi:uncharacterized protein RAG0_12992 [Rhynchosporium agropyri]|uniref:Uncharacterized protein n=1 Tax=Rhynchosporium agropyri TaxID=914238 RepID=A0A1E1LAN2_9HELO|nr:uncharacterized protein RAG0_12992 [Rhynchosporium agropyri]
MSSNITTPPRDGQRFSFKQQSEQINNTVFSMVVIPAATSLPPSKPSTSTATSPLTTSSPTTTSPPSATSTSCSGSGGLSAGAKAGIGAGVAVVALIALLLIFCLVERRKRASQLPSTFDPKYQIYETEASQTKVPLGELDVPSAELNAGDKDHAAELLAWNSR